MEMSNPLGGVSDSNNLIAGADNTPSKPIS